MALQEASSRQETRDRVLGMLGNWRWRLNNLYWITDKEGKAVQFKMNWAQEELFENMHFMNVILKCRQLGFTTFIQLFILDACLFNSNTTAGVIAHTNDDAKAIFRSKVKYPYDNLPEAIKNARPLVRDNAQELALANNSSVRVAASMRSDTLNYLHCSELGKLAAKFPERAREVRTGALNTLQAGQVAFIESTAEGKEGDFYDICERARALERKGTRLTPLDFKFFFFPWWREPGYRIDPEGVVIPEHLERYFRRLRDEHHITLDDAQKAWYAKKYESQADDMKREFPATPDESFEASIQGSFYGPQMGRAEEEGRIGFYPAIPGLPVHTAWDIGKRDSTAIWFWQRTADGPRIVGYYESSEESMRFYARKCREMYREHGWSRTDAVDYVPHDARVEEWGSGRTRLEQMREEGFKPKIPTEMSLHDGIDAVRTLLPYCRFDETLCGAGIMALKSYRKEWNDKRGIWSSTPFHNWACFPAGTQVATAYGSASIETLKIGDMVLTPNGSEKVTNVYAYHTTELVSLELADGRKVLCTPNHKFFTSTGLVTADELSYCHVLFTGKEQIWRLISLISKVVGITGIREAITASSRQGNSVGKAYITGNYTGTFGKITTARFLTVMKSTISTAIQATIPSRIWLASQTLSTDNFIGRISNQKPMLGESHRKVRHSTLGTGKRCGDAIQKGCESGRLRDLSAQEKLRKHGTPAKKAESGILRTASVLGRSESVWTKSALSAVRLLLRIGSVRNTAGRVVNLRRLTASEKVYDLTVRNEHCFIANGILTSNSDGADSFRILATAYRDLKPKKDEKKARKPEGFAGMTHADLDAEFDRTSDRDRRIGG